MKMKASELVNRFVDEVKYDTGVSHNTFLVMFEAKQCALICIEEMITELKSHEEALSIDCCHDYFKDRIKELNDLKTEIKHLSTIN